MTKAQQIHEKVDALVASGVSKADAFRQVADEYGQPPDSIRGAYYTHQRVLNPDAPRRPRKRETTSADAVEQATIVLNRAIDAIDAEVEAAKVRVEEAKAEYEHLRDSAKERKAALQAKVDVLTA